MNVPHYLRFALTLSHRTLYVILVLAPFALANAVGAQGPDRMVRLTTLHNDSLSGTMTATYSPHQSARAHQLQALLSGEVAFYEKNFDIRLPVVTLAVLNTKQWPVVAEGDPYGMPSMSDGAPYVFIMPASWEGVRWIARPTQEALVSAMSQPELSKSLTWEIVKQQGGDGIGTHEIGHSIIDSLGIDTRTHWFNEFLASYVGYVYLKNANPTAASINEIFWRSELHSDHPLTTLKTFDENYTELEQNHPTNYAWYQFAFDQRGISIYRELGLEFINKVIIAFPRNEPLQTDAQILQKLELISPGWIAWAKQLEAGDVPPTR